MEVTSYPQFLPISASSNCFKNWDCNINNKLDLNVYYKCLQGYGQIDLTSNCKYRGQIKNGMFEGKGIFEWPNGTYYEGEFKQSKIEGKGIFKWPNGTYYLGTVSNGQRQGQGTFFSAVGNYTYTGSWKKGLKQGKGKIIYKDQSIYEGQFTADKKEGYGKMTYASKNQYEGQWKNDKKCGKGSMTWANAHEKYSGQWKQDLFNGYGEYFWFENKTQYKIFKNVYKGNWKNGKREGFGAFFYSNGCRFQGYFFENMKQGSGIVIDQQGWGKMQVYTNNRPTHLLSRNFSNFRQTGATSKDSEIKLPKLNSKKFTKQQVQKILSIKQTNEPVPLSSTLINPCNQNQYIKYIDFKHPQINQTFYNMLLRHNSGLRNLYKTVGTSNSQYRQFYSGMVLQNFWKLLRDCRLVSENLSLVSINRQFSKGSRSVFQLCLPNERIIQVLKNQKYDLQSVNYEEILWYNFYQKIIRCQLDWNRLKVKMDKGQRIKLPNQPQIDIHQSSNIILFRHFVCLIIHTALLIDDSQKNMKDKVQNLIITLQHCNQNNFKAEKTQDNYTQVSFAKAVTVPEWVKLVHEEFVSELQAKTKNISGKIDISVPVRKLYSVLEMCNIFKDVNQKMIYLDRIQRYLNVKNSPLKKQYRSYYSQIDKNIKSNPNFGYLMNYQMNFKQINQFLFLCISRKFVAATQQQFQIKYIQAVRSLIKQIKQAKSKSTYPKLQLKCRRIQSWKDKAKKQLIIADEKKKIQELQHQKRKKRQQRQQLQRQQMQKQDHDAESITIESKDSYQYYE